jgi:Zn-dependent oligopeptidase
MTFVSLAMRHYSKLPAGLPYVRCPCRQTMVSSYMQISGLDLRIKKMKEAMCSIAIVIVAAGCGIQSENVLLRDWETPFQTPPFDEIKGEHFMPAFLEAMQAEKAEVEAIAGNREEPTFENTIETLEESGELLDRVSAVFSCLNGANTNDKLQSISREVAPLRAKHNDDIKLNKALFARIKQIYEEKDHLGLTPEQDTLLENYYLGFVRSGANLNDPDKEKLRSINEELSKLYVEFKQNHLKQTNETDLFNKELAASFRKNILSMGSNDTMAQYIKFKGAEPKIDALLERRGLD